jgi:porin
MSTALLVMVTPALSQEAQSQNTKESKSGYEARTTMSGPLDVSQTLEENDRVKELVFILPSVDCALKPWFDFKAKLNERYGFKLGTDYQFVSQWANDSLGEDYAAGGAYRFFFDWNVLGRGASHPGSIIFKTENRHNFSDVAPEAFSTA